MTNRFRCRISIAWFTLVCVGGVVPECRSAQNNVQLPASIEQGQRTFTVGNSFHFWVSYVLAGIAVDAGIKDHLNLGYSMIGGSWVLQHWNLPDDKNPIKAALLASKVDVLTLSGMYPPDDGVEKFVRLGLEHNPNLRVTLQEFWLPNDCYDSTLGVQKRGEKNDHNAFSGTELRRLHAPYFRDMDELVRDVNKKVGHQVVFVVPTGQAIIRLREKVMAGQVPGIRTQAELFHDDVGHPFEPVQVLAACCHYAVIYHRNPVGLPVPFMIKGTGNPRYDKEGLGLSPWWYAKHPDPKTSGTATTEDVELTRLLQELAWDTVTHHPLSGMYVGGTSEAEIQDAEAGKRAWLRSVLEKREPDRSRVVDAVAYNTIVEKVADPDTRCGFALCAREGVSKPGWMTTATFTTFECFGRYRVTFRIKCSNNGVTNTVCTVGLGTGTPGEPVTRELKGTDFTAADKYQNFSIEILRGDMVNNNCYYLLAYGGHADVSVDTITSERIGDTTDRELIAKLGINPKFEAKPLGRIAPRALWVQGPFQGVSHELEPFANAMRTLKIPCDVAEVDVPGYVAYDLPKHWDEISKYSIILLSDVNPRALGFVARKMIHDWVEQGGTLIVTGGQCAFGMGQTKGTLLEEIYPVEVTPRDLIEGGSFKSVAAAPEGCPRYRGQAGNFLIHTTTAKSNGTVVLQCNHRPLLAYQKVGLGKVVVFTGTAMESDLKIKPYWADTGWGEWSAAFLRAIFQ